MKKNVFVFSLVSVLCLGSLTLLNSCLKHNDTTPQQPVALVSVLQASPGAPYMDLYFNGSKINTGQVIGYATAGQLRPKAGNYDISFVNSVTGDTILHRQDSITGGQYYSMLVYDTASARKVLLFPDKFDQAQDASSAYIRFLQLSPDAGPVELNIGTTQYARHSFEDVMDPSNAKFNIITQGTYSFTAINPSTGDTLGTASGALAGGAAYTVYLRGLASHTNTATDTLGLKLALMQNY
jgi:hypothetical protein